MEEVKLRQFKTVLDQDNCGQTASTEGEEFWREIPLSKLRESHDKFMDRHGEVLNWCAFPVKAVKELLSGHPNAEKLMLFNVIESDEEYTVYMAVGNIKGELIKDTEQVVHIETPCCKCCN